MKLSRRAFGTLALGAAAGTGLAACSGPASGGGGGGGGSAPSGEITFWGSWVGDQAKQMEELTALFNSSQTDLTVRYVQQKELEQKLLTGLASGQVPDIVLWDRFQTSLYVPKGALQSISDRVAEDGVDVSQMYDQALGEMTVEDQLYGLPLIVDNRSLFYNEELLSEAGVEPPTNWEELLSAAEATTKRSGGKLEVSGFALDDPGLFSMWIRQAGGTMLNDDNQTVAFNSPEGMAVLEFWQELMDAGVYELGFGKGGVPFAEKKVAMTYTGPWSFSDYDKVSDLSYGTTPPVAGPTGGQAAGMGGFGLAIPEGAGNADGAWAFMKWWCADPANALEFGKISGQIPANRTAANDPYFTADEKYEALVETMEFATVRPAVPGYSDMEGKALIPNLEKFLSGEIGAEQALSASESMGNQVLAENRD
ncbi:ABC transporter substrate-binding protein [Auraticoccus monumenti]|uniref:Carbohydrate ABC transporter substrate-binding protein, CUT1 family n=1 Tax=Auraticoccus monumenti TaxID=675864 RepID=A0A1G6TKC6_9ACTN|nr:ABC transporter substrate-binding protein [Auraticoccus monumenti]SDD29479.1 carbohydrate ABC transporter substrate-binding protein, CUT1 family [Auraticoccus monumenti]